MGKCMKWNFGVADTLAIFINPHGWWWVDGAKHIKEVVLEPAYINRL